jgi:GR25 family glycosyltransferase involved in LPS biosynthesis
MKHVDIWHDIVTRNSSLSLILEDDAVFVPYFREKFARTIYTAIRTGALKIGGLIHCIKDKPHLSKTSNEWYEQDPMIVIGGCFQLHDHAFARNQTHAQPMLSTHKEKSTRCAHAYLLTACSAQAILRQINAQKNRPLGPDYLLNLHVAASPTIQSFWLDPPIVYQGNQINDLDGIPSFRRTTY